MTTKSEDKIAFQRAFSKALGRVSLYDRTAASRTAAMDQLDAHLERTASARPFLMRFTLWIHGLVLHFSMARTRDGATPSDEKIAALRFAAQFGRRANADQRAWCLQMIEGHGISRADAPFLVWSGVLHLQDQTIYFGRWDRIFGAISFLPALGLVGCGILSGLCTSMPLEESLGVVTSYFGTALFLLVLQSDKRRKTHEIAARYFTADGWSWSPASLSPSNP